MSEPEVDPLDVLSAFVEDDDAPSDSLPEEAFELSNRAQSTLPPSQIPLTHSALADAADAAIFETFVVPTYLATLGGLAVSMLQPSEATPRVAHVLSRTGYPDRDIVNALSGARIHGFDPSPFAVELANVKAASAFDLVAEYVVGEAVPSPLPEGVFTHALSLHPILAPEQRAALYEELQRLLRAAGQVVLAVPVRGSYVEIYDLLREYGLKMEKPDLDVHIARAIEMRPTVETFAGELENTGFVDVDVELRPIHLPFRNARDFFESPTVRLLVLPDLQTGLAAAADENALSYVRDAISKYWSDTEFELLINVACASARKV